MSHLSGNCSCGRTIHFDKNASMGSTWNCRSCGKSWEISSNGSQPLHDRRSLPPSSTSAKSENNSAIIYLVLIGIGIWLVITFWKIIVTGILIFLAWTFRHQIYYILYFLIKGVFSLIFAISGGILNILNSLPTPEWNNK